MRIFLNYQNGAEEVASNGSFEYQKIHLHAENIDFNCQTKILTKSGSHKNSPFFEPRPHIYIICVYWIIRNEMLKFYLYIKTYSIQKAFIFDWAQS